MIVGTCLVEVHIFESNSLKDKRHVVKSLIGRLQSRFNISVAEVDKFESWNHSVIGFSCVSNNTNHIQSIIGNVIKFIDGDNRLEITQQLTEIFWGYLWRRNWQK